MKYLIWLLILFSVGCKQKLNEFDLGYLAGKEDCRCRSIESKRISDEWANDYCPVELSKKHYEYKAFRYCQDMNHAFSKDSIKLINDFIDGYFKYCNDSCNFLK